MNAVEWKCPNFGQLKFNVDGTARGSLGDIRIDEVLRGDQGRIKCNFQSPLDGEMRVWLNC